MKGDRRDLDDSIIDATIAEMEAGIYGLQVQNVYLMILCMFLLGTIMRQR